MRILTAVFVLLALALPAHAGGGFISGKEIKSRAAAGPVKVKSNTEYEFPVELTVLANGKLEGISGNGYYDIGRWWIKGDLLCHKWDSWFDGIRKCYGVTEKAEALQLEKPTKVHFTKAKTRLK